MAQFREKQSYISCELWSRILILNWLSKLVRELKSIKVGQFWTAIICNTSMIRLLWGSDNSSKFFYFINCCDVDIFSFQVFFRIQGREGRWKESFL